MIVVAEFKKCPDCKVDARLMDSILEKGLAEGDKGEGIIGCTDIRILANIDPRKPLIAGGRIPGARIYRDICTNCGKERIVRIETGYVTPSTNPNIPPTFT